MCRSRELLQSELRSVLAAISCPYVSLSKVAEERCACRVGEFTFLFRS
jgi:hypothetical protein